MFDERARRRPDFFQGISIRLADGRDWWVPAPEDLIVADGESEDSDYVELIAAVAHAEDASDLGRAELALGIYLLERNYRLEAEELQILLEGPPDGSQAATVRASLRLIAEYHVPRQTVEELASGSALPRSSSWFGFLGRLAHRTFGRSVDSPA